jgi:DNA invertase Pin-like site-specific DNA recombinase
MPSKRKPSSTGRAVVYDRVSVADDASHAEHLERCHAFAEARGWQVVAEEKETVSGFNRSKRRPAWERVEQMVERGEVDAVVVFAISRAGRNAARLMRFVELCRDHDVTFASATEPLDTAGPMGSVFVALLGALAEMESAAKRERAIVGRSIAKKNGTWSGGRRRFGLTTDAANRIVVDELEAVRIRDAATAILNGGSIRSIVKTWNDDGVTTTGGGRWTPTHVRDLLRSDAYVPAIVTASDHRRVVELLDSRRTGTAPDRYMLSGLVRCGVDGERLVGRGGRYICTHGPEGRRVHLAVAQLALDNAVLRMVREREEEVGAFEPVEARDASDDLVQERERIVGELEHVGELLDELGPDVVRGRTRKLRADLDVIDEQLDALKPASSPDFFDTFTEADVLIRQHAEQVVVAPAARRGERFNAERVSIDWRTSR